MVPHWAYDEEFLLSCGETVFQSADAFPTLLQTIRFKSYLLSMGIANPVTRETYGSGTQYHMQLAKQLAGILQAPLEVGKSKHLLSKHC